MGYTLSPLAHSLLWCRAMEPLRESFVSRHRNQTLLFAAVALVASIYLRIHGLEKADAPQPASDDVALLELR